MPCSRCGTESLPDQKFCKNCGAPSGAAESVQSVAAAPAMPQPIATPLHPIPDGGLTQEEVVAWLASGGYSAQIVTGTNGKRHIEALTQGTKFNIMTPGCQSGRCASLEFSFGYSCHGKFPVAQLNEWNGKILWCRAYYDSVNDPWLEMDIALWPGGTFEALNGQFAEWNNRLGRFIAAYNLR
ncbi:MAG: YbjN domain-containing protein [Terracidiphilus sp.]|jgi:putative sensory transduction regulator